MESKEERAEALGTRLRKLRLDRDLSQAQLAGERYSASYVSTIEAGRRYPSPDALGFLGQQLGVDLAELTGDEHWLKEVDERVRQSLDADLAGPLLTFLGSVGARVHDARAFVGEVELLLAELVAPSSSLRAEGHARRALELLEGAYRGPALRELARARILLGDLVAPRDLPLAAGLYRSAALTAGDPRGSERLPDLPARPKAQG
jgi:transcriptional regulator with XRE-family HTH domain